MNLYLGLFQERDKQVVAARKLERNKEVKYLKQTPNPGRTINGMVFKSLFSNENKT